jgi:F-type H+-transporting ATPase subunit delta
MTSGSIARRYAKALFSLAVEKGSVEAWNESLRALVRCVEASPELTDVLENPAYGREQRRGVVLKLAQSLQLAEEPANLLQLLGDRNRLDALRGVMTAFGELADQELGRLRARVTSAIPLDDAAAAALAARLSASTQKQVLIERLVDPSIIGGVVAQVGSLVYDGSLRSQLEDLRRTLKQ